MIKRLATAALLIGLCVAPAMAQEVRLVPTNAFVTVNYRKTPVADILAEITTANGITVRFAADVKQELLQKQEVNFMMNHGAFEDALKLLLGAVNLTYTVVDEKTIEVINPPRQQ